MNETKKLRMTKTGSSLDCFEFSPIWFFEFVSDFEFKPRLGQRQNPQQRGPLQYFNSLLTGSAPEACEGGLDVERSPMIRRAIYPGSFDPVTNGHLDVIDRARKLFDEVIVAVAHNDQKHPLFTLEERLAFLQGTIGKLANVEIATLDGLLVDFAVAREAVAVIRGLRAISDFEFEFQMALMNRKLEARVETIFLMPKEEYTYLSSRIVKEIARLGGNVTEFLPTQVAAALRTKLAK